MKTIIITIGLALVLTGSVLYIANSKYQGNKIAEVAITPTPIQQVAAEMIEPTIEPTATETPIRIYPTATPIPPTEIPIPTSSQLPNLASLCSLDAESFKAEQRIKWNNKIMEIANMPYGSETLQSYGPYLKKQAEAWWNLAASSKEQWCLTHNRDYSGFTLPQANFAYPL